jgi:hypothetical protein
MTLFVVFVFLAIYNAGNMTTLQLQHYGIYPAVPKEGFAEYMRANKLWQRRLHSEMALTGYNEEKIGLLIRTNWIRTISYWLLSALAISILVRVLQTAR